MVAPTKKQLPIFVALALATLFGLNYAITPTLVGENKLEEFFRPRGESKFDSASWKDASPASGKRYEMVDDLLASQRLMGLSETDVKGLLGEADSTGDEEGEKLLVYHLAKQRDYPAKSVWFPGFFPNHEAWMLEVRLRNGSVCLTRVFFN